MLAEYGLTPWIINDNFTPELLHLIVEKRNERVQRAIDSIEEPQSSGSRRISDQELFKKMRVKTRPN